MPFDPNAEDVTVAVIGTGTMGRGIMQVAAQGGMRVIAYDTQPGAAAKAKEYIAGMLQGAVAKARLSAAEAKAAVDRIAIADDLADLAKANLIVEAIVEKLEVKQPLFQKLDELCGPDTIIVSNTSSLPVTAIAARCARHPERTGGMHFFNPVPLMKLVEVIPGLRTAPWVREAMMALGRRMMREPVLCVDSPGFIVNHAGRGIREAERILTENIATIADIDRILTGAPGLKLGPFALFDMVGIDVSHGVQESFFAQYYGEPAFQPTHLGALRMAGGLHGAKTGQGWYVHRDGKRVEPPAAEPSRQRPRSVWVLPSRDHPEMQKPLIDIFARSGITVDGGERPSPESLIVVTPIGYDLTRAINELSLDARRTVGIDVLFGMKGPRTVMVTPGIEPQMREAARGLAGSDGQAAVVINDSPGFIAQRVVAMIINTGCQIAQKGIAAPAEIDKAVKLGLGYPYGPFEWGDLIGPSRVAWILACLQQFYGEDRYRASPWLKRRAALGLPLSTPEGRE